MEQFFANPGFAHIANEILSHLDHRTLLACRQVSTLFKTFVDMDNPKRWLKRCKRVSMSDEKDAKWRKIIDSLNNTDDKLLNQVTLYLMKMSKSFYNVYSPIHCAAKEGNIELLKLAIEVMKNETSDQYYQDYDFDHKRIPMDLAAQYGHLEVFKYLEKYMRYTKCHHLSFASPYDPIFRAIGYGQAQIVKYCAQKDPIKPYSFECQQLFNYTVEVGQLEVLKVLFGTLGVPHTDDLLKMQNDASKYSAKYAKQLPDRSATFKKISNYIKSVIELA